MVTEELIEFDGRATEKTEQNVCDFRAFGAAIVLLKFNQCIDLPFR